MSLRTATLALALGGLFFLPSCSIINKPCTELCPPGTVCVAGNCVPIPDPGPDPTPTPTPTPPPPLPPEPQCEVGQEDCECYVLKPGDDDWTKLECAEGRVCVDRVCKEPTPVPTPTPPPPVSCANVPQESTLVPAAVQRPATKAGEVIAAMRELGDLSPGPGYSNDVYHQRSRENLQKLAAKLCQRGVTAFAGKEAVFVRGDDGLWEEFHAVYFGNAKWIDNGKYIGVHVTPTQAACPVQPCPIRRWSRENLPPGWGSNEIGKSAWKWNAKPHTMGNIDSTQVTVRQEAYCRAIGMSPDANGVPRASCPMRPEDWPIAGERVIIEGWITEGGPVRERCAARNSAGVCTQVVRDNACHPNNTTNPNAFLGGTGNCRICNTPGDTCSAWF